jgi:hypothetical protein
LARQVLQCQLDRRETADKTRRIDGAIPLRDGALDRPTLKQRDKRT